VHAAGFSEWARRAGAWILPRFEASLPPGALVVDLGCGTGVWARELTRAGFAVRGIDSSAAMIRLARREAPEARFQVASLFDAELPACHAVTALGEPFNYGTGALGPLFRRVWRALAPGGWFVFDIAQPGQTPVEGRRGYLLDAEWAVLFESHEGPGEQRLERRIVTFRKVGRGWRRSDEVHTQRLYCARDLASELRKLGFKVRVMRGYGDARLPGNRAVLVARRPGAKADRAGSAIAAVRPPRRR
jgi:SAM-dependent methyltransferase